MKNDLSGKILALMLIGALSVSLVTSSEANAATAKKPVSDKVVKTKNIKLKDLKHVEKLDSIDNFALTWVVVNGKLGFINKKKEVVVYPKYDYDGACEANDGLVQVWKAGKIGYINEKGKEVIPLIYDNGFEFKNGFAAVEKGDKWGFTDTN